MPDGGHQQRSPLQRARDRLTLPFACAASGALVGLLFGLLIGVPFHLLPIGAWVGAVVGACLSLWFACLFSGFPEDLS